MGPMTTLPSQSEPHVTTRAREHQRSLSMQVYMPVCLATLAAFLGTAAVSYGTFAGLINHVLLTDTLVVLLLVPALIIVFFCLVLIVGLAFGISRASVGVASLLRNGQRISANTNRTARNYAHTTKMQFERVHQLVGAPTRAVRSLRERLHITR